MQIDTLREKKQLQDLVGQVAYYKGQASDIILIPNTIISNHTPIMIAQNCQNFKVSSNQIQTINDTIVIIQSILV